ncbi:MAG TPA: hypothetical protein VK966_00310 [Longimicrobiales bacterium]|nr:hypothetical protein [Longimicrobiales bacterium]
MGTVGNNEEERGERSGSGPQSTFPPAEQRLLRLMAEFRRRQRARPDLVVRPWWSPVAAESEHPGVGFVVEYCPDGGASAELRVRSHCATVDGPGGSTHAVLALEAGWCFEGEDVGSPELLANHLLRLAGRILDVA